MSRPSNRAADHALRCVQAAVVGNMKSAPLRWGVSGINNWQSPRGDL